MRRRAPTAVRFETASPSLAFSPDGSLLAAAAISRPTEVRDARTGRLVATLRTPDYGRSVAFSPDGALLATGHYDGTGQLWSTETWKPVGRPLEGHNERRFFWMEFTPDGTMLASAGQDGAVALWDVETQNPIGPSLPIEPDSYIAADLSARRLAPVRSLPHPASRPLGHRSRGLEAARLPSRGPRAHTARVGRRAARPAVPNRLPARLKPPIQQPAGRNPSGVSHLERVLEAREPGRQAGCFQHVSQALYRRTARPARPKRPPAEVVWRRRANVWLAHTGRPLRPLEVSAPARDLRPPRSCIRGKQRVDGKVGYGLPLLAQRTQWCDQRGEITRDRGEVGCRHGEVPVGELFVRPA